MAYANEVKVRELGVPQAAIETHGAVSEEVVRAMAIGGCSRYETEVCVSVSGVAGPTGGTEEKPVERLITPGLRALGQNASGWACTENGTSAGAD